ncbi:helix-turn-helix domain-containing protein [Lysinibacillus sp. NPDC097195]|uniref:helix-turn-helix domain-containing protein n=1 Tax=Lysinibacillus sp. NPDC097195 TaxID=3364141 RepID=UPI00380744A1
MLLVAELGTRLKEARLSKGYSLDDLQEITKIQKRYLVGIEEGNYSIMPGSFYVRAFIKQYAEAVGLNPEEILETYKNELPGTPNDQVSQSLTQTSTRRKVSKTPSNKMMEAMPKVIVALFIIVIIVAIWVLFQSKSNSGTGESNDAPPVMEYDKKPKPIDNEKDKEEEDKKAQANANKDQKDDVTPDESKDDSKTDEVKQTISAGTIEADGATTSYSLTGTDTFKIRIEVSGPTFIGIRDQQQQELLAETRVYNAGEVVEFDATAQSYARIRLGNSTQAKVYINDELLTYAQQIVTQNIVVNFNKEQ